MQTTRWTTTILAALLALTTHIATALPDTGAMSIAKLPFGKTKDGTPVSVYKLTNASGASVAITNYGAIVVAIEVPDKNGKLGDVALGYDNLNDYIENNPPKRPFQQNKEVASS